MPRSFWFLLLLAAMAVTVVSLRRCTPEFGPSRTQSSLEERMRRDRMPPQPAPPAPEEAPSLWFALEEPDWSLPEIRMELVAELLARDSSLKRGTWVRAREDIERTARLDSSAILARLEALANAGPPVEGARRILPLIVPLLLEAHIANPAIFAPLWSLYREPIREELLRTNATHAARLRELLLRVPPLPGEDLALELWAADPEGFLGRSSNVDWLSHAGSERSLGPLVPALPTLESPDLLLSWTSLAVDLARRAGSLEALRATLLASATTCFDRALAKRREDEFLLRALRLEALLSETQAEQLLEERWKSFAPTSPARKQLERLKRQI